MADPVANSQTDAAAAEAAATAAAAAQASGKSKAKAITGSLVVRGPANGRWRAGRYFTGEVQTLDASKLTADEIAEIEGDPLLSVKRG
ncbi:MAG: hypothetical protein KGQ46_12440 [Hyphomicrobiales bacterium]|nr:hypothetical protein [Hyphomicrobiales bacterium]MDE2113831.1 hypothetical protein [Hyphomicrobiales bacterium]